MRLNVTVIVANATAKGITDTAIPVAGLSSSSDRPLSFEVCVLSSLEEMPLPEFVSLSLVNEFSLPPEALLSLDAASELSLSELLSSVDGSLSSLEVSFPLDVLSEPLLSGALSPLDELLSPLDVSCPLAVVSEPLLSELSLSVEVFGAECPGLPPEPL